MGKAIYSDEEIAEAIASIFKQMVMADSVMKPEEIATAVRILIERYGYLETDKQSKTISAHFGDARHETVYTIAAVLNKSLTRAQIIDLKLQLIATAMSDREFHPYEQDYMKLVDRLLKGWGY